MLRCDLSALYHCKYPRRASNLQCIESSKVWPPKLTTVIIQTVEESRLSRDSHHHRRVVKGENEMFCTCLPREGWMASGISSEVARIGDCMQWVSVSERTVQDRTNKILHVRISLILLPTKWGQTMQSSSALPNLEVQCNSFAPCCGYRYEMPKSTTQGRPIRSMLNRRSDKRHPLNVFEIEDYSTQGGSSSCLLFFRPLSFALQLLLACMTERVLECPSARRRGARNGSFFGIGTILLF